MERCRARFETECEAESRMQLLWGTVISEPIMYTTYLFSELGHIQLLALEYTDRSGDLDTVWTISAVSRVVSTAAACTSSQITKHAVSSCTCLMQLLPHSYQQFSSFCDVNKPV